MSAACAALFTALLPAAPGPAADPGACGAIGLDLAGRAEARWPAGGLDRPLTLPRGRLALGLEQPGAGARVVLGTVRSGGDDGYIGVDGEALVPRVEVAEARARVEPWGLSLAAGLVDDPWVAPGDLATGQRSLAPGLGEGLGWLDRSDIGGLAAWTSPGGWATAAATLTTGEGLARRERNEGHNLAGLLMVHPLTGADRADALVVSAYARDGSRGLGLARDHRAGLRVHGAWGPTRGGVEHLRAWGVGGDGLRQPHATSAWAGLRPGLPVAAELRVDHVVEGDAAPPAGARPTAARQELLGAVGLSLPPKGAPSPARLLLVGARGAADPALVAIAGSAAAQTQTRVGLQLDVHLQGAAALTPLDPLAR